MKRKFYRWLARMLIILGLLGLGYALSVWLCGCCPKISRPNVTHYEVDRSQCSLTPGGACVLLNENVVDQEFYTIVDAKILETEKCLYGAFPKYRRDIKLSCFTIYLPNDIRVSCADPEQFVFGKAPQAVCEEKGLPYDEDCPCGWRVAVQDGEVIVTEPKLFLFRAGVAEMLSGWPQSEIWKSEKMKRCIGF